MKKLIWFNTLAINAITLPIILISCEEKTTTANNQENPDPAINQPSIKKGENSPIEVTKKDNDLDKKPPIEVTKNQKPKDSKEINNPDYVFPKLKLLSNQSFNETREIEILQDVQDIYESGENQVFDAKKVFAYNEVTINKVNEYFTLALERILFRQSNLPSWFQAEINQEYYKNIPNLIAYFKQDDKLYKLNHKLMREFIQIQDKEIVEIDAKNLVLTKNLNNFLTNKNFQKRKIYFSFLNDLLAQKIEIDLEDLILKRNQKLPLDLYDARGLKIEYFVSLNEQNELKVYLGLKSNKNFEENIHLINDNIFFNKYNVETEISYLSLEEDDKEFSFNNYKEKDYLKLSSNQFYYDNFVKNGQRILANDSNEIFNKIKARTFVVGGGTSTMIAKVLPNNDQDYRYYFITNRHVSDLANSHWNDYRVLKKFLIPDYDDNKVRINDFNIAIDIDKQDLFFNFWQAENQSNRMGKLVNDPRKDADISISIIDIKNILNQAKTNGQNKIVEYLENWKTLPALKLSKKINSLMPKQNVQFYLGSFPQENWKQFSGRRYRQHLISSIDQILAYNDQLPQFMKYGAFRTFVQTDNLSQGIDYDLVSGASGSLVIDENGDMIALFMQNIGNDKYGFGLLSSFEYDYFGFETENNPNSFKNFLKSKIKLEPTKYTMIKF